MFNFNKEFETIFKAVAQNACSLGVSAFFVGGMVRDMLMGIEIKDVDILIEGSAIDFVRNLEAKTANGNDIPLDINIKSTHEAFNTAKTVINGIEIDFASTREEDYPLSGCLPVVKNAGCPIELDLRRRDFTINAIAAKICLKDDGQSLYYKLIDPFFGAEDIKKKILKILHNKSYIDDPTRILRGTDFMLRLNFDFSDNDKILIKEYLKSPDREGLSLDRVKLTLKKIFSGVKAKEAYKYILENEIYKIWCDTPSFKVQWANSLYNSARIFKVPIEEIFMKAIFENPVLQENPFEKCSFDKSNYEIYEFYKKFKNIDLAFLYALFDDVCALYYFTKLKDVKPDITGDDLLKQGFKQGKELGEELSYRFQLKLNSIERPL